MIEVGVANRSASWGDVSDNTITLYWCKLCGRFLKKHSDLEDWYEPKGMKMKTKTNKYPTAKKLPTSPNDIVYPLKKKDNKIPSSDRCEHCGHWSGDDEVPFRIYSEKRAKWLEAGAGQLKRYCKPWDDDLINWVEEGKQLSKAGQ